MKIDFVPKRDRFFLYMNNESTAHLDIKSKAKASLNQYIDDLYPSV